jgi:hypothetical protein
MIAPAAGPVDDGAARHLVAGTPLPLLEFASTLGGTIAPARRNGPA